MDQEDLAKEIFKSWDTKMHRYLTTEELAENFIGLGLAPDISFVQDIIKVLKTRYDPNPEQVSLKEFMRIFAPNRFCSKVCTKLVHEYKERSEEFAQSEL